MATQNTGFQFQMPWTFGGGGQQAPVANPNVPWELTSDVFDNPLFDNDSSVEMTEGLNMGLPGSTGQDPSGGGFGSMQGWGSLLGGVGDIGKAYMAYKNYGLAKDQFSFSKDFANRNLANQAVVTNQALDSKQRARGGVGSGQRVNSSPIG